MSGPTYAHLGLQKEVHELMRWLMRPQELLARESKLEKGVSSYCVKKQNTNHKKKNVEEMNVLKFGRCAREKVLLPFGFQFALLFSLKFIAEMKLRSAFYLFPYSPN